MLLRVLENSVNFSLSRVGDHAKLRTGATAEGQGYLEEDFQTGIAPVHRERRPLASATAGRRRFLAQNWRASSIHRRTFLRTRGRWSWKFLREKCSPPERRSAMRHKVAVQRN